MWLTNSGKMNGCYNLQHTRELGIFEIAQEHDNLELHLKPDYFEIGIPASNRFRVCMLREGSPVEIMINGKTDFASGSTWDRTFLEQH